MRKINSKGTIEKIIRDDGFQVFVLENYNDKDLREINPEYVLALSVVGSFNFELLPLLKHVQVLTIMDVVVDQTDVKYLLTLKKLKRLVLVDSVIKDGFDFSQIKLLEELDLNWKSYYQFSVELKLKELVLRKIDSENLLFLSKVSSLEKLEIIQGKLKSIVGIEGLANLQSLTLANLSKLEQIDGLERLDQLQHFDLRNFKGSLDISTINIDSIKWINLENVNSTSSLKTLMSSKSLRKVRIFKRGKLSPEELEVKTQFSDSTTRYYRQNDVIKKLINTFSPTNKRSEMSS